MRFYVLFLLPFIYFLNISLGIFFITSGSFPSSNKSSRRYAFIFRTLEFHYSQETLNLFFILLMTWMLHFHCPLHFACVRVLTCTSTSVFASNLVALTKSLFLSILELLHILNIGKRVKATALFLVHTTNSMGRQLYICRTNIKDLLSSYERVTCDHAVIGAPYFRYYSGNL